ncbi:hypothetical protein [uncultured Flavobacterium sp.]|uniref:hypothetical protein n=1 Tax=uncultured Flavobacterium sp. TaxID=165435 RepID=UPI0025EB4184|nr:hypothetical protein [uncultured Flavobacterium sp.]
MKYLLLLFAAFFIPALSNAQAVTPESVQGNWKMYAFNINGIYWDFKSDVVTLPAEYEKLGKSQKDAMIADIRSGLAVYKEGTLSIKGNYVEQQMDGKTGSGTFTIEKQKESTFLRIVNDNAEKTVDIMKAVIADGKLHLTIPDEMGGASTLIYCK